MPTDADYQMARYQESAQMAARGVCAICEELLSDTFYGPVADGLPYHQSCLDDPTPCGL